MLIASLLLLVASLIVVIAQPSGTPTCEYICPQDDAGGHSVTVHYPTDGSLFCRYPNESGDTQNYCVYDYETGVLTYDHDGGYCYVGARNHCVYLRRKRSTLVDVVNARRSARASEAVPVPDVVSRRASLKRSRVTVMQRAIVDGAA